MKKNIVLLILGCFMILIMGFSIFSTSYKRVDVIGENDIIFKFKQMINMPNNNLVGYATYSKKYNLSVDNIPEDVTIMCNNQQVFTIDIQNKDKYVVKDIQFTVDKAKNLRFEFPENFIVPPLSSRRLSFFVDSDCTDVPQKIAPTLKILNTDIEFIINITVEERRE